MSIAVMNWVWMHSSASGNERLALLALADACSRDDGTGCFPSVSTIARKAGVSDRTIRRVIARLEQRGDILVHRGGGRTSNSYTVVMDIHRAGRGRGDVHSPCQPVTPDSLSGVTPADRAALTQPCHRTPDIAVSPDPPWNHPVTAAPGEPEAADAEPPRDDPGDGAAPGPPAAGAGEFFAELGPAWPLAARQRDRLTPAVTAALAAGWTPAALARFAGANTGGIRSPYAVLAARLSPAELPVPSAAGNRRPPWCGDPGCDPVTRFLLDEGGYPGTIDGRAVPCPRCATPAPRQRAPASTQEPP
jgi:helix-turn-helix protein